METAAIRYEILKNIDSTAFSAKHAANIELVVRECLKIVLETKSCMDYTYVESLVSTLSNKTLVIPIKSEKRWYYRVNLPIFLFSLHHNKDYYSLLTKAVVEIISNRIIGMLVTILPQSMFNRRGYVYLMVASTIALLSFPHLSIPQLSTVLYVDDKIRYSKDDLELLHKYFTEANDVNAFWLGYLVEWVLQRKFSESVLSLKMKKAFITEIALIIDSNLKQSLNCKRPPGYQFLIDSIFGLTTIPYVYKLWPQITTVFESISDFCVNKLVRG